jgi:hypothetical protein
MTEVEKGLPCQCADPDCKANSIKVYKSVERMACYERTIIEQGERIAALDGRRRESRQLLRRMVKYVTEDRATTKGVTRLARLTAEVDDYLNRTAELQDVLR